MSSGKVITFYSYKGGVGRTLALANVAVCLAKWGHRVLCIDWDLEAPGLHLYFGGRDWSRKVPGLVDLIAEFAAGNRPQWRAHVHVHGATKVSVLSAGRQDADYRKRMQALDWNRLYEQDDVGTFLEQLREEWTSEFDFILLDSRTGVSDIGGICTIQLPDVVALLFTANDQSVDGALSVATSAAAQRRLLPITRAGIEFVPIASRFEGRVEKKTADRWLARFAKVWSPIYREWAHKSVTAAQLLQHLRVPYVPFWSFGEKLPVVEEGTRDSEMIGYAFETIAALFAHRLAGTDVLVSNRDNFVASARGGGQIAPTDGFKHDIFFSFAKADQTFAGRLITELVALKLKIFPSWGPSAGGDEWISESAAAMQSSKHFVLLAGDRLTPWQVQETMSFLGLSLTEQSRTRRIVPVALPSTDLDELPPILRQLQVVRADLRDARATAREISRAVRTAKLSSPADDPQKGKWGGIPEANGRRLSAEVRESKGDPEWFYIALKVESTDPSRPLSGKVTFHLHDTFDPPDQTVHARGGIAKMTIGAYGAFTVGADADDGRTLLELDLAELEDAPSDFREN